MTERTNSARTTIHVAGPGRRRVTADVVGPGDGPVVVFFHPAPGSRRFDPDPAVTAGAGIRLVTVDRPGYGGTDPLPADEAPTVAAAADDVAAVLDHLGIGDAVLAGWSAGGRVAAALAARRPELARALFVIGTPAPDDVVPWVPDEQRPAIEVMRADPVAAVGQLAAMLAGGTAGEGGDEAADPDVDPVAMVTAGPADEAALARGDLRARLEDMLALAFDAGPGGLAADIVSSTVVPWGFDAAAIGCPSRCLSGGADRLVPPAHGEWWAAQIPGATTGVLPAAGHLVAVDAWPEVVAAVSPTSLSRPAPGGTC